MSKVSRWNYVRSKLKKEFESKGITSCELKYSGCMRDNFLSFAHAKKRRYLTDEELYIVILACQPCHHKIEYDPNMQSIVEGVINRR